jgi:activator of 2-hydroxyglutaryl-CoA dehydratase
MLHIVGIDIGSVAISLVVIDKKGEISHSSYQFHSGAISETLRLMLSNVDISRIGGIAMTLSGPEVLSNAHRYDTQIAIIAAVKNYHREVGSILFIGGENFGLITFNDQGDYERYRSNSSCAAGTGSFLDQQAKRLNLKSIEMLSNVAFCNLETASLVRTEFFYKSIRCFSPCLIYTFYCFSGKQIYFIFLKIPISFYSDS